MLRYYQSGGFIFRRSPKGTPVSAQVDVVVIRQCGNLMEHEYTAILNALNALPDKDPNAP